jgi:DNA polymerase-3 subunit epsilon
MSRNLLWVDVETSGLSPLAHEITQIACVLTDPTGRKVLDAYGAVMNLERPILASPEALRINRYPDGGWEEAVPRPEVASRVAELSSGTVLAGHNVGFDEGFLRALLDDPRHGLRPDWDYHRLDTASLAYPWVAAGRIRSMSLRDVAAFFGVGRLVEHDAVADVEAARQVFLAITERMGQLPSLGGEGGR